MLCAADGLGEGRRSPEEVSYAPVIVPTDSLKKYMRLVHFHGIRDSWKEDHIPIGQHLNDWIGGELVLSRVLLMGYPTVPQSEAQVLVVAAGEVSAIVDKYAGPRSPSFVISPLPRGGFSGGPVISEYGLLLGVMTEALISADAPAELGFGAALTVEPLWKLLATTRILPASNGDFVRDLLETEEFTRQHSPRTHGALSVSTAGT